MISINFHDAKNAHVSVMGKLSEKKEDWYVSVVIEVGVNSVTLYFENCEDVRKFLKDVADGNEARSVELEREKKA